MNIYSFGFRNRLLCVSLLPGCCYSHRYSINALKDCKINKTKYPKLFNKKTKTKKTISADQNRQSEYLWLDFIVTMNGNTFIRAPWRLGAVGKSSGRRWGEIGGLNWCRICRQFEIGGARKASGNSLRSVPPQFRSSHPPPPSRWHNAVAHNGPTQQPSGTCVLKRPGRDVHSLIHSLNIIHINVSLHRFVRYR